MNKTYKNKNGVPIIRKCTNCINFKQIDDNQTIGYCKLIKLNFAFTHEQSLYAMVKDFYVCQSHEFQNENVLRSESEEVELLPYLLDRNAKKKA
jgi:hypothetical protein